jgi:hypothetical protein
VSARASTAASGQQQQKVPTSGKNARHGFQRLEKVPAQKRNFSDVLKVVSCFSLSSAGRLS